MDVGFLSADLGKWNGARPADVLAVSLWRDVRPLRGAVGLLDWRLCGRLSGWIESGRLGGGAHEQTLFPTGKVLPWKMALALGLGDSAAFSEAKFRETVRRTLDAVRRLSLRTLALALPGRESDRIAPQRALEILLEEARVGAVSELTIIEPPAAQKEMQEILRKRARGF